MLQVVDALAGYGQHSTRDAIWSAVSGGSPTLPEDSQMSFMHAGGAQAEKGIPDGHGGAAPPPEGHHCRAADAAAPRPKHCW